VSVLPVVDRVRLVIKRWLPGPRAGGLLRWLVALGLLAVVFSRVDVAAIGSRIAGADLRLAIPAIAGLVASQLIAASAWRSLLGRLVGVAISWPATVRIHFAAQTLGAVTPGNVGADIYRVAALESDAGRTRLALVVIVQRLTSVAAIVVLGGVGALALPIVGDVTAVVALALVGLGAIGLPALLLARFSPGSGGPNGTWIAVVRDGLGLGLLFHLVGLAFGFVLVLALDRNAATGHAGQVLGALAVARLSLAVPILPNGIGLQEGALAILFAQLGLDPGIAVAAMLLNRVAMLATIVAGAAAMAAGRAAAASPASPSLTRLEAKRRV
jgi:uncharacterized membrane protein YbhN (UPF0104 family)